MNLRILSLALLATLASFSIGAVEAGQEQQQSLTAGQTFADGGSHIVATTISAPVLISNNTQVQVEGDGWLRTLSGGVAAEVFDGSQLGLISGRIWGTTSGPQDGIGVHLHDNARLDVSGGEIRGTTSGPGTATGILLEASSEASISGGEIRASTSEPGAAFGAIVRGSSMLKVSGGNISAITNGLVSFGISANDHAKVEITAGEIFTFSTGSRYELAANGASRITIVGSHFNYPVHLPISDLTGSVSGFFANGTSFSFRFNRAATASIVLIPEPHSAGMLAWAAIALWSKYRPRRSATSS